MNAVTRPVISTRENHIISTEFSYDNWQLLKNAKTFSAEADQFVDGVLQLMAEARFNPKDCTSSLAWVMGVMMPSFLPSSWGGIIPAFTEADRHQLIDRYLKKNNWLSLERGMSILEMGCGYPPATAIDAAQFFSDCSVIGADPNVPDILVYDQDGNYASMKKSGDVIYFHPSAAHPGAVLGMYRNPKAVQAHFNSLLSEVRDKFSLYEGIHDFTKVDSNGATFIFNPIKGDYVENLTLMKGGIGDDFGTFDVVRCFNVLYYFDGDFRKRAESWALKSLVDGGIFLCGGDSARTIEAQYCVFQRRKNILVPSEFSISVGNIRPLSISPWFSMHASDKESSASAYIVGILRNDSEFRIFHDNLLDLILCESRLWIRNAEGYLVAPDDQLPISEWEGTREQAIKRLCENDVAERAVHLLNRLGFRAWVNSVGHISVDPIDVPYYK